MDITYKKSDLWHDSKISANQIAISKLLEVSKNLFGAKIKSTILLEGSIFQKYHPPAILSTKADYKLHITCEAKTKGAAVSHYMLSLIGLKPKAPGTHLTVLFADLPAIITSSILKLILPGYFPFSNKKLLLIPIIGIRHWKVYVLGPSLGFFHTLRESDKSYFRT